MKNFEKWAMTKFCPSDAVIEEKFFGGDNSLWYATTLLEAFKRVNYRIKPHNFGLFLVKM